MKQGNKIIVGGLLGVAVAFWLISAAPKPLELATGSASSPEALTIAQTAWPKVIEACKGFTRHSASLKPEGIEDNFKFADPHAQRVEAVFSVPQNDTAIPASYGAGGHRCFVSISRDGSRATIGKTACKALCLDTSVGLPEKRRVFVKGC